MIRYYEEQTLLPAAARDSNGYRSYEESLIPRARQVTALLAAGLPSRTVLHLLDSLTDAGGIYPEHVDPATVQAVEDEYERMCRCVDCMAARRDALRAYLDELGDRSGDVG